MSAAVARRGLVILKSYPLAVVGGAGLAVIAACCGLAGIVAPYNPTAEDLNALLKGPSLRHWMGTDLLAETSSVWSSMEADRRS